MRLSKLLGLVFASIILAACGGGSSSGNASSDNPGSSSTPSAPQSSASHTSDQQASSSSEAEPSSESGNSSVGESSAEAQSSEVPSSESGSSSNGESSSSESPLVAVAWNIYDGSNSPLAANTIQFADGNTGEFVLGGNAPDASYITVLGDGRINLNTSASNAHQYHATLENVVNSQGDYPKHFTLIAAVSAPSATRVVEFEMAFADTDSAGSRLKAILRNDGSNTGIQLERAIDAGDTSIQQYSLPMSQTNVWHIAVTLTDATTGSYRVYRNGGEITVLSRDGVDMRPTGDNGHNFLRFGDGSGSHAYQSDIDWIIWTDEAAYAAGELSGRLPENIGCIVGYGASDDTTGCAGSPTSNSPSSSSGSSSSSPAPVDLEPPSDTAGELLSCEAANTVQGFASLDAGTTGGGQNGWYIVAKTGADLEAAIAQKRRNDTPLTIYINGTVTTANSTSRKFDIKEVNNLSIIGVADRGIVEGVGFHIVRSSNIIIRNLTMRYVDQGEKDHISLDGNRSTPSKNIWIDHNRFYNSLVAPGCSSENCHKNYYDELVSGKGNIDNITISYNYFHDSWKTSLWGSGDGNDDHRRVSFISNRWENVNSRLPLFRFGEAHVVNNYYKDVMGTGINSRMGATIYVENNWFENARNVLISQDSREVGYWNATGNVLQNVSWGEFPSNCTNTKHCSWGGAPGTTQNGGDFTAIGSHDTVSTVNYIPPYEFDAVSSEDVREHVLANTGPILTRECLGIPSDDELDAAYVSSGGGSGGDGGNGDDDSGGTGSGTVTVAGGWDAGPMELGSSQDVSGSVTHSSETAINAQFYSGKFESSRDAFYFVSKSVEGDFVFTATLKSIQSPTNNNSQGQIGIMLCVECENGASSTSARAQIGVSNDSGSWKIIAEHRANEGGSRVGGGNGHRDPVVTVGNDLVLRLTRQDNAYSAEFSVDGGVTWAEKRAEPFDNILPDQVRIGVYGSHGNKNSNAFEFDNISLIELDP